MNRPGPAGHVRSPAGVRGGIVIVGAGAIGSVIGARLVEAGIPAAVTARGDHFEVMRRGGLTLETPGEPSRLVRVRAFATLAEAARAADPVSVVILTVKAFGTAVAAAEVATVFPSVAEPRAESSLELSSPARRKRAPMVVCLGNGVGAEEAALEYVHPSRLAAATITLSVERPAPGRVRILTTHGGIALGPAAGPPAAPTARSAAGPPAAYLAPDLECLADTLRRAGFRAHLYPRGDAVKWSKLLLNLWANATSAAFNMEPAEIVRQPPVFRLDWLAFHEALLVMRRLGIPVVDLPGYPTRLLVALARALPPDAFRRLFGHRVAGGRGGKMPSLWLDVAAGRPRTEVSALNGAVSRAADRLGLNAPVNALLEAAVVARIAGATRVS